MMNVGNPDRAFTFSRIPNEGVGLARLEFIINKMIGIHPKALTSLSDLDKKLRTEINKRISAYKGPVDFYVQRLSEGIATIAAAFHAKPVIVRMSDFKSNEYANLLGGKNWNPKRKTQCLVLGVLQDIYQNLLENALNWNVWLLRESEMIWV